MNVNKELVMQSSEGKSVLGKKNFKIKAPRIGVSLEFFVRLFVFAFWKIPEDHGTGVQ